MTASLIADYLAGFERPNWRPLYTLYHILKNLKNLYKSLIVKKDDYYQNIFLSSLIIGNFFLFFNNI